MTAIGWLQILVFFALVVAVTQAARRLHVPRLRGRAAAAAAPARPHRAPALSPRRRRRASRSRPGSSTRSRCCVFSALRRARDLPHRSGCSTLLPLNPQKLGAVEPTLAFNTAASFTTNTNWQSYSGESTMSYLTQMAGLAWHNFTSAAAGIGVALAVARGLTRRPGPDGAQHARQLLGRSDPRASSTCSCRCRFVVRARPGLAGRDSRTSPPTQR